MKSKSRILLISTIIIFILTIFIGTSYSLWQTINTQDSVNTATTKCFNVEITSQKNSISLENAYPITNEKGKKLTPFSFTITNTCDIFASYTVSLESLNGTTLSSKFLNAMINNEEINKLSDYEATDTVNEGSIESHILAKGSLGSGDSEDYTLRVWIDYDTTMEDLDNEIKTFKSKVVVKAQPSSWSPVDEGYTTLHDAILANEYQSGPETAISKIESKGTPDLSKTAPIINWEEKHNVATTYLTVTKLDEKAIKSDEATSGTSKSDTLLHLASSYSFNNQTGIFNLENFVEIDPTKIDWNNSNNNFFIHDEKVQFDASGKISSGYSTSGTLIYKVIGAEKSNGNINLNGKDYPAINYKLNVITYDQSINESDKSDKGLYKSSDNYGVTYYYRGNVKNNFVKFADMTWQIIRINGDNSIRIMYYNDDSNTTYNSQFNGGWDSPAFTGYKYGKDITSKENINKNENDSTIKSRLDTWYKQKILTNGFNIYVADNGFCNNRNLASNSQGNGVQTDVDTKYESYYNLWNNIASFNCNNENDFFTTNNSNTGNKSLAYPIGLITYDELMYSGLNASILNTLSWTYSENFYWTMSPSLFSSYYKTAYNVCYNIGRVSDWCWVNWDMMFKPVISLKSDVEISGGIGTINDPFVVKTE